MTFAELRRGEAWAVWATQAQHLVLDVARYGLVSVASLACDCGVLLLLIRSGVHYLIASLLSFSVGSLVSYILCIRFVFASRRGGSREAEAAGFFAVGVAGLALTQLLLWIFVSKLDLPLEWAKATTVAIVFFFNFGVRRSLVFARGAPV